MHIARLYCWTHHDMIIIWRSWLSAYCSLYTPTGRDIRKMSLNFESIHGLLANQTNNACWWWRVWKSNWQSWYFTKCLFFCQVTDCSIVKHSLRARCCCMLHLTGRKETKVTILPPSFTQTNSFGRDELQWRFDRVRVHAPTNQVVNLTTKLCLYRQVSTSSKWFLSTSARSQHRDPIATSPSGSRTQWIFVCRRVSWKTQFCDWADCFVLCCVEIVFSSDWTIL